MADRTTGELTPVKESPIGGLPEVLELYDDTLLPVEQQGMAMRMTGRQFRQFGEKTAELYVQGAKDAAQAAKKSEESAAESEESAAESARKAEQYSGRPPLPDPETGNWQTWNADSQEYADTGETYRGSLLYATFYIDPATGMLYQVTDSDYTGPQFRLNGTDLEVILNAEP